MLLTLTRWIRLVLRQQKSNGTASHDELDLKPAKNITTVFILTAIVLAGLYFRFDGLSGLGLGFDEQMHIYAAKSILETGEPILPSGRRYGRAILFTYSVALSFKLFGVSEMSARLPSVAFGTLSVLAVFFIGKRFFGTGVGLIAAALIAFLPFEIVWSRASRMYSMYQFFFLLMFFAFYKGLEGGRGDETTMKLDYTWLAVFLPLFYITYKLQSEAIIFGGSVLVYLSSLAVLSKIIQEFPKGLRKKYVGFSVLLTLAASAALAVPRVLETVRRHYEFSPHWANETPASPTAYFRFLASPSLFPILIFFVLGAIQVCMRVDKKGYYTLVAAMVPLVIHSFFVSVQRPRYIFDIFPLIILIASYSIYHIWNSEIRRFYSILKDRIKKNRLATTFSPALLWVACLVLFVPFYPAIQNALEISSIQGYRFGGEYNAQWRQACRYVRQQEQPGDVIIASIPLNAEFSGCSSVAYSLDNGELDQFLPREGDRFQRHPFADSKAIVNLDDLKYMLSDNPKGWVVMDSQRFNSTSNVPENIRKFIVHNMKRHAIEADKSIQVYSWP